MRNYYPERMELGPRDVVARALIMKFRRESTNMGSGVDLPSFKQKFGKVLRVRPFKFRGIDFQRNVVGDGLLMEEV